MKKQVSDIVVIAMHLDGAKVLDIATFCRCTVGTVSQRLRHWKNRESYEAWRKRRENTKLSLKKQQGDIAYQLRVYGTRPKCRIRKPRARPLKG